ncbi:hypothetical protein AA0498_2259 [Acidomonas methanolica]|nr:hypothetical protein AA0498_2259 [Acidomonas methanolica]
MEAKSGNNTPHDNNEMAPSHKYQEDYIEFNISRNDNNIISNITQIYFRIFLTMGRFYLNK